MDSTDITTTAAHLLHTVDDLRWQIDWLLLDRGSIDEEEVLDALYEIRLATLAHGSIVTEFLCRAEELLGADADTYELSASLRALFESLRQLREAIGEQTRTGEVTPAASSLSRFETTVDSLLATERALFTTCGSLLFPSQIS